MTANVSSNKQQHQQQQLQHQSDTKNLQPLKPQLHIQSYSVHPQPPQQPSHTIQLPQSNLIQTKTVSGNFGTSGGSGAQQTRTLNSQQSSLNNQSHSSVRRQSQGVSSSSFNQTIMLQTSFPSASNQANGEEGKRSGNASQKSKSSGMNEPALQSSNSSHHSSSVNSGTPQSSSKDINFSSQIQQSHQNTLIQQHQKQQLMIQSKGKDYSTLKGPSIHSYHQSQSQSYSQRMSSKIEIIEERKQQQPEPLLKLQDSSGKKRGDQDSRKKSMTVFNQSPNPLASEIHQPQDDQIMMVRQFLPQDQVNASRSNHYKNKFTAKPNGPSQQIAPDEGEALQANNILLKVAKDGDLNLRESKLVSLPRSIYYQKLDHILYLNLKGNELQKVDEELCKNLIQLRKLDLRNNKIKEISQHVKALMQLKSLRLDFNELTMLPNEIGELQLLQDLSFSNNKIIQIPQTIQKLRQLKLLNLSHNNINHLPQEMGELRELRRLYLNGNKFSSFPCSFVNFVHLLEELSLEWFMYARPPKPTLVKRSIPDGLEILQQLESLCQLLQKYTMNECALLTFLENYSINVLEINSKDNRQRTPLHNAAVKGDNGVLEGLLKGQANPNLLDKDNCTPLCLAIREDNFEAAVILIDVKVDVNLGGGIYGSPLHLAVVKVEVWIVKKLIMNNADVNRADNEGNTPLHLVMTVFSKNPQRCASIAELLVLNGAKVNAKNNDNWSPLHSAVRKGQEKGVQTIIRLNQLLAEKGIENFDLNITGGAQQFNALQLAAHGGYLQIVKDLLNAGADIFQRNLQSQLPRHCAKGNYILTKYLKLAEQAQAQKRYQSYSIHNQFELLQNVTQKKKSPLEENASHQKKKTINIEQIAEEYALNYDTFMNNIAQLKVMKTFTQIDIVKKVMKLGSNLNAKPTLANQSIQLSNSNTTKQNFAPLKGNVTPKKLLQETFENQNQLQNFTQFQQSFAKSQKFNQQYFKQQSFVSNSSDSKFLALNSRAEDKKINLFYLKDILLKESSSYQDKLKALEKIKKHSNQQVFSAAMSSLIPDIEKINESFIQKEILYAISSSCHMALLQPLKELRAKLKIQDLEEDVEEAIAGLEAFSKRSSNFTFQRASSAQGQVSSFQSLQGSTQTNNPSNSFNSIIRTSFIPPSSDINSQKKEVQSQKNGASGEGKAISELEKSRNINSFKMKGMSSLVGSGVGSGIDSTQKQNANTKSLGLGIHHSGARSAAGTPAAQNQIFSRPKFLEGIDDAKIVTSLNFNNENLHGAYKLGQTLPVNLIQKREAHLQNQKVINSSTWGNMFANNITNQSIKLPTDYHNSLQQSSTQKQSYDAKIVRQAKQSNSNYASTNHQENMAMTKPQTQMEQVYTLSANENKNKRHSSSQYTTIIQTSQLAHQPTQQDEIQQKGQDSHNQPNVAGQKAWGSKERNNLHSDRQKQQQNFLGTKKKYTNHMIIRLASDGDCEDEDHDFLDDQRQGNEQLHQQQHSHLATAVLHHQHLKSFDSRLQPKPSHELSQRPQRFTQQRQDEVDHLINQESEGDHADEEEEDEDDLNHRENMSRESCIYSNFQTKQLMNQNALVNKDQPLDPFKQVKQSKSPQCSSRSQAQREQALFQMVGVGGVTSKRCGQNSYGKVEGDKSNRQRINEKQVNQILKHSETIPAKR